MCIVTVDMIETFIDKGGYCFFSYPCIHGEFEITLKDGRRSKARFTSVEVYVILQDLYNMGTVNENWSHFSKYSELAKSEWNTKSSTELLSHIFV
jgi:hypothetical protein